MSGTDIQAYLLPIESGFIGWVTTFLAIKMLFHPKQPVNLVFYKFQGIFPKNKSKIAEKLGDVVQKDLISFSEIKGKLQDPESMEKFNDEISVHVERIIREKVDSMKIGKIFISENFIQNIHQMAIDEIQLALPGVIDKYIDNIEEKADIKKMVFEKVAAFSDDKFEDLLLSITKKEFRFIELCGGFFGFLIGIIQMLLSGVL